ncbi:MAG: riboflavin biosynthesis protein RibF [Muribaculaceae bacterium]|nr:riboflavin biosynthesis protein RibF [Muribaculaceae bacterium]
MEKTAPGVGRAVTVGTFDGVHRGHREVLRTLREEAAARGLVPSVVTFDRHPLEIVAPERAPRLLQLPEERAAMLRETGVEVIEVAFTSELSAMTAREWAAILRDHYGMRLLISGYDNKFGSDGRAMSAADYLRLGEEMGFAVVTAPELSGICSSAIRRAVAAGDMTRAAEMMGRPYSLSGRVEEGRHLGRTIGFPTANLAVSPRILLPAPGVYAGRLDGMPAVINIGDNPTVGQGNPITVEAHAIGFSGDLYGRDLRLEFSERIRGERKFGSLEQLKEQIGKDILFAREKNNSYIC